MFAAINPAHLEVLAIDVAAVSVDAARRADKVISKAGVQTTTEMLMLLAAFHADVDDAAGSELIAAFAARFAEHEATIV